MSDWYMKKTNVRLIAYLNKETGELKYFLKNVDKIMGDNWERIPALNIIYRTPEVGCPQILKDFGAVKEA